MNPTWAATGDGFRLFNRGRMPPRGANDFETRLHPFKHVSAAKPKFVPDASGDAKRYPLKPYERESACQVPLVGT